MRTDLVSLAAAAGVSGLLGSMYLDAKLLLSKDLHQIRSGIASLIKQTQWTRQDRLHFYFRFKERAKENPNGIFLLFEGQEYTFQYIEKHSNRFAHWLLSNKIKKNDIVCMMHQNHPTFFITLLGISKIGAIPSLINTNLSEKALLHCIKIAESKLLIFDPLFEAQVATISKECQEMGIELIAYGEATENESSNPIPYASTLTPYTLSGHTDKDTSEDFLRGIGNSDPAYLIYTSGTTGMPKAAISQHFRACFGGVMFSHCAGLKKGDRVYCVLPLYHSSGLIVSVTSTLVSGGTIVLGRKFSVSRFWNDCADYKVDSFTYIGEFCRYLLSQPHHPEERNHKVRMVFGNGMRPDVWTKFRERFNIPTICEFYAATEGPAGLFNANTGEIGTGAIGFRGRLFSLLRKDSQLIKIDPITEEPLRDKNGFCVKSPYDEQGELIVRVEENGLVKFDGYYKNKSATNKKLLRDVFQKGDCYFRSGDLIKKDKDGYYYFGDRVGDTFRWKSENVATTEIAQVLGEYPGVYEANVYGALVPKHDGRAGMAAIVLKEGTQIDFKHLCGYLQKNLPKYAVPLFLRFVPSMEITGTFKQQKVAFRNQGIDLTKIPESEPVYWLKGNTYVPFTLEDFAKIDVGKVKL
ncbi:hypothetical protein BD560DRAFT_380393 [Blakeslea trispora]|nr:hypothetical protein BD560DRAFT_380393 [Blakeslea trispora]